MDRRTLTTWAVAGAMAMLPIAADAQERGRDGRGPRGGRGSIPAGHLPPPGECRVWYDDRPPGQQPPPTSCGEARRVADRTGGRVIYGGNEGRDERGDRRDRDDDRRDRDDDRRDRDRDRDRDGCVDVDRDGRCDVGDDRRRDPDDRRRYPGTLPETVWGVVFGRGDRLAVSGVRQWLGRSDVSPRYTDADRDDRPEAVDWYDARGTLLQRWVDTNRDGRADRVTIYENGRAVRTIP